MAFIPTADTARVSVVLDWGGQEVVMTFWFKRDGGWTTLLLSTLCDAFLDWLTDHFMPGRSTTLSVTEVNAVDQASVSGPSVTVAPGTPIVGAETSDSMAQNVAAVVTNRTTLRGRSFRGRNYVPGIMVGNFASTGVFSTGFVSGLLAVWAFISDIESATDSVHSVVSHFTGGAARVSGVATPIIDYTMDLPSDSQRRRLPGRGI